MLSVATIIANLVTMTIQICVRPAMVIILLTMILMVHQDHFAGPPVIVAALTRITHGTGIKEHAACLKLNATLLPTLLVLPATQDSERVS